MQNGWLFDVIAYLLAFFYVFEWRCVSVTYKKEWKKIAIPALDISK